MVRDSYTVLGKTYDTLQIALDAAQAEVQRRCSHKPRKTLGNVEHRVVVMRADGTVAAEVQS